MNELLRYLNGNPSLLPYALALLAAAILILAVRGLLRRQARIRREELNPYRITLRDIDQMEGSEFERYLQNLLLELGYAEVYKTQESKDYGADLVFTDRSGFRIVLQAKRYHADSRIGLGAVQEIYTSMRYYEADRSIVLASAGYTATCQTLAGVNGVRLLDREDLTTLIDDFKSGNREGAMDLLESEPQWVESPWSRPSGQASSGKSAVSPPAGAAAPGHKLR
ncbi:MAG: endonuclease [Paenibacillaceae bacterium]|jgi:restriction system protein|nr:endonuclease [Paenibacillaceae bacterium]